MRRINLPPTPAERAHFTRLRTLQEMADEFGVHVASLKNAMRYDPHHPAPKLCTGKKNYYEPGPFRTWWAVYGLPAEVA